MSLATEKTKTQWFSNNNVAYDSKEDAEYASVQSILGEAAVNRFVVSPFNLVDQLKNYPETWAWLQQQMSGTVAELPKETASINISDAIALAKSQIIRNENVNIKYLDIDSDRISKELSKHYILVKKP